MIPSGIIVCVFGIFLASINTMVLDLILQKFMVLTPQSQTYPMWKDMSNMLHADFYFFNLTNMEAVRDAGAKPELKQIGPYKFFEQHHKFDIVWNANGTVTYKQRKVWKHVGGDLEDLITVLNIPYASVGDQVDKLPEVEKALAGIAVAAALPTEKLFVTVPIREFLFEGYDDPMLDAASKLEKVGIKLPGVTSKFGFFFGRNNSWYADGITNVYTGSSGIGKRNSLTLSIFPRYSDAFLSILFNLLIVLNLSILSMSILFILYSISSFMLSFTGKLGRVHAVNYTDHSNFFVGDCGQVNGSADFFPPYLGGRQQEFVFNQDLCRSLILTSTGEYVKVHGTTGEAYVQPKFMFANHTDNEHNICYVNGPVDIPSGLFDASPCRFGAPVFMSQPHFYQADPFYASLLQKGSVEPSEAKHETKFIFEPISGVPLDLHVRYEFLRLITAFRTPTVQAFQSSYTSGIPRFKGSIIHKFPRFNVPANFLNVPFLSKVPHFY